MKLDGDHIHTHNMQNKKRLRPTEDDEHTVKSHGVQTCMIKKEEETMKDKDSLAYQRLMWDALKKSINDLVHKVTAFNIRNIATELFSVDLIKGRGIFCRAILKSSLVSPTSVPVLAALVSTINTKFPDVGYLLLKRMIVQLKFAYKRCDNVQTSSVLKLLAHLVNQCVVYATLALESLMFLLQEPCEDYNVEMAVSFLIECGYALQDVTPPGRLDSVFECFYEILQQGQIQKQSQFLIVRLFAIRNKKFSDYPDIRPELDIVDLDDQVTHEISFGSEMDPELSLDIFNPADPQFQDKEDCYGAAKRST